MIVLFTCIKIGLTTLSFKSSWTQTAKTFFIKTALACTVVFARVSHTSALTQKGNFGEKRYPFETKVSYSYFCFIYIPSNLL